MTIYLKRLSLFLLILFAISCVNNKVKQPVKVSEAFVQSWTTAEGKSQGTHIEVTIIGKVGEAKILGIVYNKQQVTPIVEMQKKQSIIRADFEKGTQQIFETPSATHKENMIIYSYRGKIYELPLRNIARKYTQYYPVK